MEASYVEEVHCVAMHPAAGLLLLGFHDKLRLLCIRDEELRWGDRACNREEATYNCLGSAASCILDEELV